MRNATIIASTLISVACVVAALWLWGHAWQLADNTSRPQVLVWAARCVAVSVASAGQVVLLTLVVGTIWRRGVLDNVLRILAALVCTLSLASAVALALAAR